MSDFLPNSDDPSFEQFISDIRNCRVCHDHPRYGQPMEPEPRPIIQVSQTACICIASQAPGTRVYQSGKPFNDASGVRLRQWMGISDEDFYDDSKIAIIPMGFCFPGLRSDGSDLPPRRECKEIWRSQLFARLPNLKLLLTIGGYAQRWHMGPQTAKQGVTETVRAWRQYYLADPSLRVYPLPHPSWHNNRWLTQNVWFEDEVLPQLRSDIRSLIA
ncbi:uracil-DNA glycosylase [Advenella sp. S44]|uniref:uracil-DNA glycosylase family protein n=1 Tax=Advenella sp. S44 TaxID=1982755 RepID=UPI000C299E44|nr:uracil-DNA glycosylase family protein [Advenella sp. S44]PJX28119.1 uracil-DNA glycosylase [Advenella sp. S44]